MWYVIKQIDVDSIFCIYIGSSEKKARKIAEENENYKCFIYCYVGYYNKRRR